MRFPGFESRTKAALEVFVIHGLRHITDHPILQGAVPSNLIRVSGDENCRDPMSHINQVSVKLEPRHSRHLNVSY